MDPQDQPFFQLNVSQRATHSSAIRWQVEQEWRHVGDIDLSQLAPDDAFCFVPDYQAADQVARLCHWPVIVLESEHGHD